MNTRILIVDDEPDIVQSYVDFLNFRQTAPKRSSRSAAAPAPIGGAPPADLDDSGDRRA